MSKQPTPGPCQAMRRLRLEVVTQAEGIDLPPRALDPRA